ncbi:hypothetical protein [Bacteriovorax sp. BSW11_IV]|uniref:hypothetical protein n=1 Tax=Bacteriovorax sp. BSW11_IV TaxID=1353529 RepID=UPI0018CAE9BD|nr:hypothetical protein [Bacteriovorax sp. BSW11_IV]
MLKLLTHLTLIFQLILCSNVYAQEFGGFVMPKQVTLHPQKVDDVRCENLVFSSNPSITSVKCLNEISFSGRRSNMSVNGAEQAKKIYKTITSGAQSSFLNNLISRDFNMNSLDFYCRKVDDDRSIVSQLSKNVDAITNCNVSDKIEDRCDCINNAVKSGRIPKISDSERNGLNDIIISNAGKTAFMNTLGQHSKNSTILAYFITNGTKEQRAKILANKGAHACIPGKIKEIIAKDKCDSKIKQKLSLSLVNRDKKCSTEKNLAKDDAQLCGEWNEFKDALNIQKLSEKDNAWSTLVDKYDASQRELFFDSKNAVNKEFAQVSADEFIKDLKERPASDLGGRWFSYPRSSEEMRAFIDSIKKYEKEKAAIQGVGLFKQSEAHLMGTKMQGDYVQAMEMVTHIYRSPFLRDRFKGLFNDINATKSLGSFYQEAAVKLDMNGIGDIEKFITDIENEELDKAMASCADVGKKFSNSCNMQSPLTNVTPEDFLTRGNEILSALQNAVNDVPTIGRPAFESGAMQYYCSIYAATLENGKVDLLNDKVPVVADYSFRQKTNDFFKNSFGQTVEGKEVLGKIENEGNDKKAFSEVFQDNSVFAEAVKYANTSSDSTGTNLFTPPVVSAPTDMIQAKKALNSIEKTLGESFDSELKASLQEDLDKIKKEFEISDSNKKTNSADSKDDPRLTELLKKLETMTKKVEVLSAENNKKREQLAKANAENTQTVQGPSSSKVKSAKNSARQSSGAGQGAVAANFRQGAAIGSGSSSLSGGSSAPSSSASNSSSSSSLVQRNSGRSALSLTLKETVKGSVVVANKTEVYAALINSNGVPVMLQISEGVFEKYEPIVDEKGNVVVKDGVPLFKKIIVKVDAKKGKKQLISAKPKESDEKDEGKRKIYRLDDLNREIDQSKKK